MCLESFRAVAFRVVALLGLVAGAVGCSQPAPGQAAQASADPSPDEIAFGTPDSLLFWTVEQKIVGFRQIAHLYDTREIAAGGEVRVLPEMPVDLSGVRVEFDDESYDLDGFVERNHVVGLLVLKDGNIALERYENGNTPDTKWVSFSVTKSVVSLLVGAAVRDGFIADLDASVTEYLPMLHGSAYEAVTVRQAMQMASGVQWNEDYADPNSDLSRTGGLPSLELLRFLGGQPRAAAPGTRFNYNTGETHLVAAVLRAAIGNNLSTYLSNKIWRPFGMEADANWVLLEPGGAEHGGCCISATLRDYGRIGLFALGGGVLPGGDRVLPEQWMAESISPSPANDGYGYLWWLREGAAFSATGIFGQMIWIDPSANLVVVTHSTWPAATGSFGHAFAFARAVRKVYQRRP